ncbi:MAG: alkaline phosphatase family protein [Balneolaceae bacterium]
MAILFFFIDGIGVGDAGEHNPLANESLIFFSSLTKQNGIHSGCEAVLESDLLYRPIDANLEVDGLPQSGTGQATLFSGQNAAKINGRHFGPFPPTKTRHLLKKESLFHHLLQAGKQPHFINAYPEVFFEKVKKRNRWTATTMMTLAAGLKVNRTKDIMEGRAVTADITQNAWREQLHMDVPMITEKEAADRLLHAATRYDLVLFEYYLTDKAGHLQQMETAEGVLQSLDRLLTAVSDGLRSGDTLVLTSDHGNLEDLSIKKHTRNPVPLIVKGTSDHFHTCRSIMDVTPAIVKALLKG